MASTYSSLKIQLMATGENSGAWGSVTNVNLGTALEEAIVGSADVSFTNADVTLTLTDTNATQTARNLRLNLTGTIASPQSLIVPAIEKIYIINNGLSQTVTVKNSTGTGIAVPAGKTMYVYNNGTDVVDAITHLTSLTLGTALPVASGGTGSTTATFSGANITSINANNISSGTLDANRLPTTGVNANSITAGTLAVAQGGTGQTTYTNGQLLIGSTTPGGLVAATLTQGSGITITNGAGSITIASSAAGGLTGSSAFFAPGTLTTPSSTTKVYIQIASGGGGGGGASGAGGPGGNGGNGRYAEGVIGVAASTPYTITVGAGGNAGNYNGGPDNGNAGGAGGLSSFGNIITCNGGNAGNGGRNTPSVPGNPGNPGNITAPADPSVGQFTAANTPFISPFAIGGVGGSSPANGVAGTGGFVLVAY